MLRVGGGRKRIGQSQGKHEKRGRELHWVPREVPSPEGKVAASNGVQPLPTELSRD